ncbi:MAG TPA: hypothetical protein VJL58_09845, partial [Pyrinomonadaceae bacterium]|nr:hypothetical protein [Pyrinomonadaceae bacterium]
MEILQDGSYVIGGKIAIDGEGSSAFVFGRGWLLEILRITKGEYYFLADGLEVRPKGSCFGVFYPSFTFVRPFVRKIKGELRGIGSVRS